MQFPQTERIIKANIKLKKVISRTATVKNQKLSEEYGANIYLKREDLQIVRSYKIRGAYNKISNLSKEHIDKGIVCASAGNHAQGVAYACHRLKIKGKIFMPNTTPSQKVTQVQMFGKEYVEIVLAADTFDDAQEMALKDSAESGAIFIPPFNDIEVMEGQGTVGLDILESIDCEIDYLFVPIGGGGLASGVGSLFKDLSPATKIIGVEPLGAPAMKTSLDSGELVTLKQIDTFVDGAAVKRVGDLTFEICKKVLDDIILVPEGKVCSTILKLYNEEAIVVEPAGALAVAALQYYSSQIKGKNVVCIVSGSNNDITRTEEIKERSMLYEGLKHYFLISFPQRAGALREFVDEVLGATDDITHFEYKKKNNRERGPALVGIVVKQRQDLELLIKRMEQRGVGYQYLNDQSDLFQYII